MHVGGRLLRVVAAVAALCAACGSDGGTSTTATATVTPPKTCTWPMAGAGLARTHSTGCDTEGVVGADTLDRLEPAWFTETRAEVTGAPAVTADSVYAGDWSGRVYAVDRATGKVRWTKDTPVDPMVYAGQIPASPTVTKLDDEEVLVLASGRTVWVLQTSDGSTVWNHVLGDPEDPKDPIEIEGSPTVTGDLILVPSDVHEDKTNRSGVFALDLADGKVRWHWDPEAGKAAGGCGAVWGTPAVDETAGLAVVGTGSCFSKKSWTDASEAIVGLDLETGQARWTYQPRPFNERDWDYAGAPNLFRIGDRAVAGLGNKDGWYYVVDRETGALVWKAQAVRPTDSPDGFAFGGFIGATSVAPDSKGRPVVTGGTAVGDCPCQHGFDAATGKALWQNPDPGGTYGASASAGGVVFTAGIDQTLRAFDLGSGKVRWKHGLPAISASGPSIAGDLLVIGVGFSEPGTASPPSGGLQAFRVLAPGETAPTSSTTTLPEGPAVTVLEPSGQACVGAPCDVDFTLKDPPPGQKPTMTLEITPSPLRITVKTTDLGPPSRWLDADGPAAEDGATVYAVFITPRDDKPELGSIVCILDDDGTCTGTQIDVPADAYTRLSVVALTDADTPPSVAEGYDRLVTTHSFDPGLVPAS